MLMRSHEQLRVITQLSHHLRPKGYQAPEDKRLIYGAEVSPWYRSSQALHVPFKILVLHTAVAHLLTGGLMVGGVVKHGVCEEDAEGVLHQAQ